MPAARQTEAPTDVHKSLTLTNLSLMTVVSMFAALTQEAGRRTAGSVMAGLAGSVVVPLMRAAGGVWPGSSGQTTASERQPRNTAKMKSEPCG